MFQSLFWPITNDKAEPVPTNGEEDIDRVFIEINDFLRERKGINDWESREKTYFFDDSNDLNNKYDIGKFSQTWVDDFLFLRDSGDEYILNEFTLKQMEYVYFTDASGANKNLFIEVFGAKRAKSISQVIDMQTLK
jgi:hypothetical protein